jgi:DNA repair protein RadA/Sms
VAEVTPRPRGGARAPSPGAVPMALPLDVVAAEAGAPRLACGLGEVDRVLGGGIVPGSLVLLGGDPGIGKSTLALDLARRCGAAGAPTLYAAGEESAAQLALRARRTGCAGPEVAVLAETDLDAVLAAIEHHRPALTVVDSVQTLHDAGVAGSPGSVAQVREAVARLLLTAKATGTAVLLIGHVTKEGAIAGPRTLEHMVDVVLYLEGERHGDHRLLRGVKNRFGATDELGILVLDEAGMREAPMPGRAFLDTATLGVPGNVLTVTCEGSRPLAVEVQALVVPTSFGLPRRTASGFDLGRLHVLLAVLEKRGGVPLGQADVYLNVVGGVRLGEPAADLAVVLAVASAARDRPAPQGMVALGEVGLGGEVRRVRRLDARLAEAAALGLDGAVLAATQRCATPGIRARWAASVPEALTVLG